MYKKIFIQKKNSKKYITRHTRHLVTSESKFYKIKVDPIFTPSLVFI